MQKGFSLIIPIHNEEAILKKAVGELYRYLKSLKGLKAFEIILACNGCTDSSVNICKELSSRIPEIKTLEIEGRGLGTAIHESARKASHDMMMFYAIDLPFGLDIIGESINAAAATNGAVVIGSKGHRQSRVQRGLARTMFSFAIAALNNLFFGLGVNDTQGSILFYKAPFKKFDKLMDSGGAFFQTQILIYSKLSGLRLVEIPVSLNEVRKTRFRLIGDGLRYVSSILKEKKKLLGANIR